MKAFFDTSIIVDIDRGNEETVNLMKKLAEEDYPLYISTVSVAEILTGAYREDKQKEVRKILGQFIWMEMDGKVADKTAEIMANLYGKGKPIEFQDVVIAASADVIQTDSIVTRNEEHFNYMDLDIDILSPDEVKQEINPQ